MGIRQLKVQKKVMLVPADCLKSNREFCFLGKVTSLRTGKTSDAAGDYSLGRDHLAHAICPI